MFDDYGQTYLHIDKNSGNILEIFEDVIDIGLNNYNIFIR